MLPYHARHAWTGTCTLSQEVLGFCVGPAMEQRITGPQEGLKRKYN